ncbi:hypothetical protein [Dendrosporobacter sp. 1207_IL3150]|uniref:hypothetical protein n=1 Tax=Dendrosporobacter sp. 1207_IL3150 TaxID=3084054 RepID=UPI002FDB8DD8
MSLTIWMSSDMKEKISYNEEFSLMQVGSIQSVTLGNNINEAKNVLKKMGREDIIKQLHQ